VSLWLDVVLVFSLLVAVILLVEYRRACGKPVIWLVVAMLGLAVAFALIVVAHSV
jgi:hypothetical protein